VFFEEERFWVLKQPSGEIIALYDRDPLTGCTVPWDPNRELLGKTGWFHDACSQSVYDLTGACFSGPCEIGLNRLNVREVDGAVIVDMSDGGRGALRSENGEPLNPPR
jgi:nitrite reductase/ring-hydroxylating ferredoxin subunit